MERQSSIYQNYIKILERELIPSMGCTEPIAIAYCAAKARSVLGELPDLIEVEASGNIIKNAKSVTVPNTGGGRGIAVAAAIGTLAGNETKGLEVIANIPDKLKMRRQDYLFNTTIIPLRDLETEISVFPDEQTLKAFCITNNVDIVLIYSQEVKAQNNIAYTRVFAPKFGYLEDPATGSGNNAFGYYMIKK
jgi:L-cysteine desulfidase